jgi:hypothetical protein
MSRHTAASDLDYQESIGDSVEPQETSPPDPPRSRPCEVCPNTAWLVEIGPDGLARYQCAQGHLKLWQPSTTRRSA